MEFLGVGPMELILILILALIILGPSDMVKTGRTIGRTLRRIVKSSYWTAIMDTSRNLRNLPNRLMREAGLEEEIKDLKQEQQDLREQVNEMLKIKAPLVAAANEAKEEGRSIQGSFSAWTSPSNAQASAHTQSPLKETSGLSAWITPQAASRDEIVEAAPDSQFQEDTLSNPMETQGEDPSIQVLPSEADSISPTPTIPSEN